MTFVPENLTQNVTIVVMGSLTWIRRLMYQVGFLSPSHRRWSPRIGSDSLTGYRRIESKQYAVSEDLAPIACPKAIHPPARSSKQTEPHPGTPRDPACEAGNVVR
jgi:hypothetical protein